LLLAQSKHIVKEGAAFSYVAQTNAITLSGPAWCSCLSGVWEQKHGVLDNDEVIQMNPEYQHLFQLLKSVDPKIRTLLVLDGLPWKK